ncbi:MAG: sulfotransferase family protein [Ectothiorhodospiraceae bacterium]|nr:sulfotransferase family protein [Ectothiorhodospiraceae bacterium]
MPLSVIGAGFGRTGTMSLQIAIEMLGLGPCYHMREVLKHPGHVDVWSAATRGEAVDWEALFGDYRAAVDWPACHFWAELAEHYPEARIILTHRDPERWYRSISQTIYASLTEPREITDPGMLARRDMARALILDRVFDGRLGDHAYAVDTFRRHLETVRRTAPPDRLLVYDVAEGWGPLCAFLRVPIPAEPFPQVNSTDEFRARMVAPR